LRLFPLAPSQRALLFAQQLAPDTALTVAQYLDLRGTIDREALLAACDRAARDIESGTVVLVDVDGRPHQAAVPDIDDAPRFLDLGGAEDPHAAAIAWMTERTARPIDPFADRLAEMTLIRLDDDRHYLHCFAHHIVMDGAAAQVLTRRISELYTATVNGEVAPQSDCAPVEEVWRAVESYPGSRREAIDREYWRARLDSLPPPVSLGHRVGPLATPARRSLGALPDAMANTRVERQSGSLPEVPLIVAAFAAYIARVTGADDVVLSLPVSARTTAVLRRSAGSVSNVVPLRVRIESGDTAADLVHRVQLEITGALRHQRFRYDEMLAAMPAREARAGIGGVFGPVVNIMQFPQQLTFGDVVAELHILSTGPVDDLSLTVYSGTAGRGTRVDLEANPTRYSDDSLRLHHRRFLGLLEALHSSPHRRVGDLPIGLPGENNRVAPAHGARIDSGVVLLPDVLTRHVDRDSVAVRDRTTELTYRDLDTRSSALARRLISQGCGPESAVAVVLPRSLDSVVALWAVAKAGAAYVPVDPDLPPLRLAEHLAGVTVALTDREVALPRNVLRIDPDAAGWDTAPVTDADRTRPLRADNPAWIVHTSGSTGRPKAVVVSHRGIAGLVSTLRRRYTANADSRVLHMSSPSFDAAIQEVLLAADAGATLVVADANTVAGELLTKFVSTESVTHMVASPAVLAATSSEGLQELGMLDSGGEALPVPVARRWAAERTMVNAYGPTETTVLAAVSAPLDADRLADATSVPIGNPVDGTALVVLDGRLRVVPPGIVGELYVIGPSLARGYGGRPGPTAERFVASVFGSDRMYRTGDLVRWGADGQLEFVGRADDQIQIRGIRVEPGEVEASLAEHPDVDGVATISVDGRLVSYVCGRSASPRHLREWLAERLPRHLVPDRIATLESLPLTAAGKVDRAALAAMAPPLDDTGRAVHGPLEALIAEAASEVLGTEMRDASADFFEIGGNSLGASQLAARISAATGRRITVKDVFVQRTVAGLAGAVLGSAERPPLVRRGGPSTAVAPAQKRLWMYSHARPESTAYHLPFTVGLHGTLSTGALDSALRDVMARHSPLRTVIRDGDGEPQRIVLPIEDAFVPPEVVDVASDSESGSDALEFSSTAFSLASHAPIRFRLQRFGADHHVLVVVAHHVALDGLSFAPLVDDLVSAYRSRSAGQDPLWPPLEIDYDDYAQWHRAVLDSGAQDEDVAYWTSVLAGTADVPALPLDRSRGSRAGTAERVTLALGPGTRDALHRVARDHDATTFMIVHAAVAVLLSAITGSGDTVVATVDSGRSDPALDALVGMFVGTVVLRAEVDPEESFGGLLDAVRVHDVEALVHSVTPFDVVQEHLGASIPFQAVLTQENFGDPVIELSDLTFHGREVTGTDARFDLEIAICGGSDTGLDLRFTYDSSLLDRETVQSWSELLGAVIDSAVDDPSTRVGDLVPSGSIDRGPADHGVLTLPEIILGPTQVCDVAGGPVEVHDAAERLAGHLGGLGVGPEDFVGVLLPRSAESLTAVLAIARTGAAFVPLDPAQPPQRIAAILADIGARFVVAGPDSTLPPGITRIDPSAGGTIAAAEGTPWFVLPHPDHPAYAIYTSGSTGEPKGVVVTHRGLSPLAASLRRAFGVTTESRILHSASTVFDASVLEYLLVLGTGATMVLAPAEAHGADELAEILASQRITHWFTTPAVATRVGPEGLDRLRVLGLGGEAWTSGLASRWAPGRTLLNLYGPTEATVVATIGGPIDPGGVVPIGRPIDGMSTAVLDARLRPVAVGVVGELYLAGPALARGYLGRPGQTAAHFVASVVGTGRMYRTGDRVRRRADGELEFVGRADRQIQIRGMRVELGEIEAVLASHRDVDTAVVVVREGVVVAYVHGAESIDIERLRRYAMDRLPRHMVPGLVHVLDRVPLTVAGKIDRAALPSPVVASPDSVFRGAAEEIVGGVMSDVLAVEGVGRDTDFFAHGGDSLSATRFASRVGAALDVRVDVRDIFEHSTVARLAAALSDRETGARSYPSVAKPAGPVPLSPAQQRMWLLNRKDRSGSDNIAFALDIDGDLDVDALFAALADLQERHAALRTVFPDNGGGAVQSVRPTMQVPEYVDSPGGCEPELASIASVGFDLATEVPVRMRLYRTGPDRHTLAVVAHHIALDGLSTGPLHRDFVQAFAARRAGRRPEWSPLEMEFADYAYWHRTMLGDPASPGSRAHRDLSHWRATLDARTPPPELPADRKRNRESLSAEAGIVRFAIPAELHAALRKIAREYDSTLFMVVHAALSVLLSKLAGSDDVSIGTPVSGRTEPHLDDVVGMFVGTVVLRTEVAPARSFVDLLGRVRRTDLEAFAHAELPFDAVVDELMPRRTVTDHPFFRVMLAYESFVPDDLSLPGLQVRSRELHSGRTRLDLEVTLRERASSLDEAGGLDGSFTYARDLFDHETVARWAPWLLRVLEAVADDPTVEVRAIDLAPAAAAAGGAAIRDAPGIHPSGMTVAANSLGELFAQCAAESPESIAVVAGDDRLTYADLDARSARLARALVVAGVEAEDVVAVALPRSADLIVAMLAVARAGASYLPLDVTQPDARLARLIADAQAELVLCTEDFESPVRSMTLESATAGVESDRFGATGIPIRADQAAYVIYTSGSTGEPKGVSVSHANVLALLANSYAGFGFGPTDVWTMFHSPAFDFSVWEMWGALTTGGRIVVVDHLVARNPHEFRALLVREQVTVLNQTPTAFGQLVEVDGDPGELALRLLIFGGEALEVDRVRGWLDRHRGIRAINMFGITETTVHVTWADVEAVSDGRSVIGVPLPGLQVELLDRALGQVPRGVIGEIYIAGPQVARGYRARPGLTAGRFVAAPDGGIRYRTGDLARLRNDGTLEFHGRSDSQLQIRGHRIEPGEVRAGLARIPGIGDSAVVVRDERVVAYVVGDERLPDPRAVMRAMRRFLPDYMVPAVVVPVATLPMTTNGKLDHAALPPASEFGSHTDVIAATGSPFEDVIAGVYRELLGTDRVGRDDDFFELGGNSLQATRLAGRLAAITGAEIGVRDVFEAAGVADLARIAEERLGAGPHRSGPRATTPARVEGPLSPAQRRMWFLQNLAPESGAYNLPFVLRIRGDLARPALRQALRDVVERHRALRTVYTNGIGGLVQRVVETPEFDLEPVPVPEVALSGCVEAFAALPFDLESAPPIRIRLYRTGATDHALVVVIHHIAADEWSLAPLLRDLERAYRAGAAGVPAGLGTAAIEYIDYAAWQHETPDAGLPYWVTTLAGIPEQCTLPADHPRSGALSTRAASVHVSLGAECVERIAATAGKHRATSFMVMHAALAAVLHRHNGSRDIVIGTAVAGRGNPDLDDVVGMFASTLVLRTNVDPGQSFAGFLELVRRRDIEAFVHADSPFESVVERLAPVRDSSHHPLFQVALSMRRPDDLRIELPGVTVTTEPAAVNAVQFDLQLTVTETRSALDLEFVYRRDLYDHATVEAFAARFVSFVDTVTADPGALVGDVDLLSDSERSGLVPASGGVAAPATVWSLLSSGARIAGTGPAIVAGECTVTYDELIFRAEGLAGVLHAHGAGPGVLVACALPRSIESVVAVWAIARTGAAPVMIDPAHPSARVAAMLEACGARIGVTTGDRSARLPAATRWIDVTSTGEGEIPYPEVDPDEAAYVVFTSGTTGQAKAVVLTPRGLGPLAADLNDVFAADPLSRVLHVASPGFDAALLEMLTAGAAGARLVIAPDDAYGGEELAALIDRHAVTHACVTPSVLSTVGQRNFPHLEVLMLGGERVPPELVRRWGGRCRLFNGYGPAESTVFATFAGPLESDDRGIIGKPARGIDVVVLDERLRPVPTGVTGELYLAGDRIAAGYAGAPGLTSTRFVAGASGRRWYRTGDLARWLEGPTGPSLDFRGRNDDQVKIRGIRIEPTEIDSALAGFAGVSHSTTVVHRGPTGASVLASYVAPAGLDPAELRRGLTAVLPNYMVPTSIITVDSIPLTPNGKVDLGRLPAPLVGAGADPVTGREELVADVFSSALGIPVGRTDDFFAAGGDSLLATSVVARLRARTGSDLPLRLLFEEPTVAGLAAVLDVGGFETLDSGPAATIRPERIPLTRAQSRMWAQRNVGRGDEYRMPARVVLRGPLDVAALDAALVDLVARHEILRTDYGTDDHGPYAIVRPVDRSMRLLGIGPRRPAGALGVCLRADGEDAHTLDVDLDHLAADGASVAVLLRDLTTAYRARVAGVPPRWDPLPLQYSDYALWERDREASGADRDFWQRELDDFDPAILPSGPMPNSGPQSPGAVVFTLDSGVAQGLSDIAAAHRATEFMVVHAVLAALLSRLTGHGDIGIAAVVSGRRYPQLEPLVGLFVETVVLRARVAPDMPFTGLLGQVRDFDVAALDRSAVPVEDVLAAVGARMPQVALAFQDFTPPHVQIDDLEITAHELDDRTSKFDLLVTLSRSATGDLHGTLVYDTSHFDDEMARILASQFADALVDAVERPDVAVQDLSIAVTDVARGGTPDTPRMLAAMLRATAAAHPDRVAVVDGSDTLTYRELDRQSDELARVLSEERGVGAEDVVAVDAARSLGRLRMLWAVAKSGAAFGVEERIDRSFSGTTDSVDSLAYVIATSGSSGEPKQVAVTHRGLAALAAAARARYRVGPGDRVLHGYNPAFDAALLEVLLAHTSGATLVIAPPDVFAGPALHDLLRRQQVTHFLSTPSVLATLNSDGLDALRVVASGGELLTPEVSERWRTGRTMLDAYGPTESTIVATLVDVDGSGGIGAPIPGTSAVVLDGRLRPVPVGGVGELYLAGDGLARGYLGAPATSAEHFVASVFGDGRMYRTGDLVQVRRDGRMLFLGRVDRQVKIRGIRMEPGRVETVLLRCRGVRYAAVVPRGDTLVAFVAGDGIDSDGVFGELAGDLPPAFIPSRVHVLTSLPTTPNGKLDLEALSRMADALAATSSHRPLTAAETLVTAVVRDVLGHDVDVDAGFFALGGHSLGAVEVAARLSGAVHRHVSPRAVLESATLAALADRLATTDTDTRPRLVAGAPGRPIPMAPAQRRLWMLHQADPSAYTMPVVLRLRGFLDIDALTAALGDVVDRHEPLRTVYPDEHSQRVLGADRFVVDCVTEPSAADEVARRVRELVDRPLDLVEGPPLRVGLHRCGDHADNEWVLAVVTHHIAVDGASVAPLLRDLERAYAARREGRIPDWEPLPLRYGDFAEWQTRLLGDLSDPESTGGRQLAYWETTLADLPAAPLGLPFDNPRPAVSTHRGGAVHARIGSELHSEIADFARSHGVTVFMVLHAALTVLLARLGDRTDVTVGTVVGGRSDARLAPLAGMFVGTVALRTRVDLDESFADLVRRVRDVDLGAFAHADIPFDDVVARVAPARTAAHHPVFQVLLAHSTSGSSLPRLGDCEIADLGEGAPSTQFDLVWDASESADGSGVAVRLVHALDLFDAGTAETLLSAWIDLLARAVSAAGSSIDDLVLSVPTSIMDGDTAPPSRTLAEILGESVRRFPDRVALCSAARRWTYTELDAAAVRRAAQLRNRGVRAGSFVAVDAARGPDWVIDVWAITRLGAAWVPIDPTHSAERQRRLLDDAAASTSDALAYLLYTSGTTGEPKGVEVTHEGMAALVDLQARRLGIDEKSIVLQAASPTFDASVFELLAAHAHGGTLVCAPESAFAGRDLQTVVENEAITHLNLTPTVLATLDPAGFTRELTVVSAGEALPPSLARAWARHRVHNGYGPTECTVGVTCTDVLGGGPVSIGTPIAGTGLRVLDARLRPVPVGTTGELYVGGSGLARGYHGLFGMTASRFVADPWGEAGARLYRTGDVVRLRSDGRLEYVGRSDDQIQIHGVRVEPAGVDSVLLAEESVGAAVTVPHHRSTGETVLVSYVVPAAGAEVDPEDLRVRIGSALPPHHVPASISVIEEIPRSSGGKVDRNALPQPSHADRSIDGASPQGTTEKRVAGVMAEVIGCVGVPRDRSFFELGGTSMAALRLVTRLRDEYGYDVALAELFTDPTAAGVARQIGARGAEQDPLGTLVRLNVPDEPRGAPLFCVHPVSGLAWCYAGLAETLRDRPLYGLQATGESPDSVTTLAHRYVEHVRSVQPEGPYHLLGWSLGGNIAHEMAVQLRAAGADVATLALLDSFPPDAVPDRSAAPEHAVGETEGLDPEMVRRVVETGERLEVAAQQHRPGVFDGDAVLFTASHEPDGRCGLPDLWRRFVTGRILEKPVPCLHSEMGAPAPLQHVAGVLAELYEGEP